MEGKNVSDYSGVPEETILFKRLWFLLIHSLAFAGRKKSPKCFFLPSCLSGLIWNTVFSFPVQKTGRLNYKGKKALGFEGTC